MVAAYRDAQAWLAKAAQVESSETARNERIDKREEIYHGDWKTGPNPNDPNVERVVDIMPKVVCDRAVDRLCGMPMILRCRSELVDIAALPDEMAQQMLGNPDGITDLMSKLEARARDAADLKEAAMLGLVYRLERQQRQHLTRMLTRNAVVTGYAGPVRWGYSPDCDTSLGTLPFSFQVLDPRGYYEVLTAGAGLGPQTVIYQRRAKRSDLSFEGWSTYHQNILDDLDPDDELVLYDCWERVQKAGKKVEIWNATILHGGKNNLEEWWKKPVNMAIGGLLTIPYVCVPVRQDPYRHESYPEDVAHAFLDPYIQNWEARCRLLSRQAELVAQAVEPTTLTRADGDVDVEFGRGNNIQVRPEESVEILGLQANPTIAQAYQLVEEQTQKGTFAAASYGQGVGVNSALQAGRLQEASENSLNGPKAAAELALEVSFTILANLVHAYGKRKLLLPGPGLSTLALDPKEITGDEMWEVKLPAMSRVEANQQAAAARALSEPRADGTKWISDETSREMSGVLQNEHQESDRLAREMRAKFEQVDVPEAQLQREVKRQEDLNDARAQMAMQAQMAQQLGAPQAPEGTQPPGVAQSPLAETQPDAGQLEHNPQQPVAGV